jgi:hypothetical protein
MKLRKIWRLLLFTILPVLAASLILFPAIAHPETVVAADSYSPSEKFDPQGEFWPVGGPPKGMENVDGFTLRANGKLGYVSSWSFVSLTNGTHLRFISATVQRKKLVFRTATVRGVSFSFDGRFLRGGVFGTMSVGDRRTVAEGTLQKFKAGQQVAEANLKFTYFGGT